MKYILSAIVNIILCGILLLRPFMTYSDADSEVSIIMLAIASIVAIISIIISVRFIFPYIRNRNDGDLLSIQKLYNTLKFNILLNFILIFTLSFVAMLVNLIIATVAILLLGSSGF